MAFVPNPNALKWAEALESGKYEQGTGYLHTTPEHEPPAFCCLGVACQLAIADGVPLNVDNSAGMVSYNDRSATPPTPVLEWLGLRSDLGSYERPGYTGASLAEDNDQGASFKQIAQTIRTNPSLYREP